MGMGKSSVVHTELLPLCYSQRQCGTEMNDLASKHNSIDFQNYYIYPDLSSCDESRTNLMFDD